LSLVLAGEVFIPASVVKRLQTGEVRNLPTELASLADENPLRQLSARQRETMALMIEGHSNKEIARKLGLLESTVKAHIKVILRKLNAQNRTQAALIAADLGWPRPVKARA
jgi:two-component system nitrate/nitrite response regulator NarL